MSKYDEATITNMVDRFLRGRNKDPITLAMDTFTRLEDAKFSQTAALKLTEIICNNYYKDRKDLKEDELREIKL